MSVLQERGNKQLAKGSAAAHFVLICATLVLGTVWLWEPCSQPFVCRAQSFGFGVVYALFASQLIMAHMCKEPFQAPLWALLTMTVGVLNKVLKVYDPLMVTLAVDGVILFGYLHYVVVVINQICHHLDINCLTIKPKVVKQVE